MRSFWVSSGLLALLGLAAALPCAAVECGDTITDAQTLTEDLECTTNPGLRIVGGGSLDMNGFKLTCNGSSNGIWLLDDGAELSNGVVSGCSNVAVDGDANKYKVHHVLVSASTVGFRFFGTGNKITDCAVTGSLMFGVYAGAGGNTFTRIMIQTADGGGMFAGGANNKISDVSISGTASFPGSANDAAVYVAGSENKISKVRVNGAAYGFYVSGNSNKVSEVTSLNHGVYGVHIQGDSNQVKKCVVSAGPGANGGFYINGAGNSLAGSRSMGGNYGISLEGPNNIISKNRVLGSTSIGLFAYGPSSILTGNIVVGSGTADLYEGQPDCNTGNVWSKNVGKANDACID